MKALILLSVAVLVTGCREHRPKEPTIDYHGEQFRLSRHFDDYDEYKETEDNLHPDEIDRIAKKIASIQIPKHYKSRMEFVLAALKIKFPGFGFGGIDSLSNVHTALIEIPHRKSDRYITAIETNSTWVVVDDFIASFSGRETVQLSEGTINYMDRDGKVFRSVKIKP